MKKIAMIMEANKRAFACTRASWFLKKIQEMEEEISIYIFRSAGAWTLDLNYNIGEYNIYHLPDLTEFDGIILDVNSIHQRENYGCGAAAWEYIVNAARQSGKPVLSLANRIEGFYHVGIDNYAAMRLMMEHVFQVHGCRNFWFIMGPKDNYENGQRIQAVTDYLKEHDVPCGDDRFYCESFEIRSGYRGFLKLYEIHGEHPEAIICGNDEIAVGVCKAAEEMGFSVPGDFIVTGFDNFDKASYFSPRITTIDQQQKMLVDKGMELFSRVWRGEAVEECCYTKAEGVFWDSCGCQTDVQIDLAEHVRKDILLEAEQSDFEEAIKMLEYELLYCETPEQMYEKILNGLDSLQCEGMYLVLDENIEDFQNAADGSLEDIAQLSGKGRFHETGYPVRMKKVFIDPKSGKVSMEMKSRKELFYAHETDKRSKEYLFLPLHFSRYTVGYIVIVNAVYLMENRYLNKMMSTIMTSMENFYRNKRLEYINRQLQEISMRDAMTGLYNRLGYQNRACHIFSENKEKSQDLSILFIDMDRLKYMNDTFGHECGDLAIKITAEAILRYRPDDAVAIRMGGDEFLVVLPKMQPEEIEKIVTNIRTDIDANAKIHKLPCELSISTGSINTDMRNGKELDDYVRMADEIMYQEKSAKKKQRK
ncbi:MAG: GGDEF domain-containing protein [Lachnospiraceae bacterium]|nr:GGDEF domain-containing protein [Lachnospiraceae bacterium]